MSAKYLMTSSAAPGSAAALSSASAASRLDSPARSMSPYTSSGVTGNCVRRAISVTAAGHSAPLLRCSTTTANSSAEYAPLSATHCASPMKAAATFAGTADLRNATNTPSTYAPRCFTYASLVAVSW